MYIVTFYYAQNILNKWGVRLVQTIYLLAKALYWNPCSNLNIQAKFKLNRTLTLNLLSNESKYTTCLNKSVLEFEPFIHVVAEKYLTKKCFKMLVKNKENLHLKGSRSLINTKLINTQYNMTFQNKKCV